MREQRRIWVLWMAIAAMSLMFFSVATAANKVVVVPMKESAVGDAESSDVVKGKIFSTTAGEGLTGTLDIHGSNMFYTNSVGMEFSPIPPGSFIMGSPDGSGDTGHRPVWPAENPRGTDERQHIVILTKAFFMQTTEVTQGQWEGVMGSNPSHFSSCGSDCPVEYVSWDDAQAFITALNNAEGRTGCDADPRPGGCCFLPSEAQWEYAIRGGTVSKYYHMGTDPGAIGWYTSNSGNPKVTHPVAQKEPNNWGLYDMSGNVWEWCSDWLVDYPVEPSEDPVGAGTGTNRVIRGGSYGNFQPNLRSAERNSYPPGNAEKFLGFRIALSSGG